MITLHKIIIHEPDVLSVEAKSSDLVTTIIHIQGPVSIGQCWPLTKAALPVTHRLSLHIARPLIGLWMGDCGLLLEANSQENL